MLRSEFILQSEITILFLTIIFLYCSCAKTDLPPTRAKNATEKIAVDSQSSAADTRESGNISSANFSPTSPITADEKIKLPYQTAPRRKTINLSDECFRPVVEGSKNWELILACAEAIEAIKPEIEKTAAENKCDSSFEKLPNNSSYEVIDDEELLAYTVKITDSRELSALAKKLETTTESLFKNSDLPESSPYEVKAGQLLKYQKAHYNYEYYVTFYSLAANEYLVEMRCSTGAYNLSNIYLSYDESALPVKARVLEFPSFKFTHDEDSDVAKTIEKVMVTMIGGRFFDPKTKQLIAFVKARGIGDAGEYARYSFPNNKPKLEEFRAKFKWEGHSYQTGDVIKSPPKNWRRYYP